jgi:hypothetical protein
VDDLHLRPATDPAAPSDPPSWWHRGHPVFVPLTGFFSGLVLVLLVPGLFAALLGSFLEPHTTTDLFPLVLVALAVPAVLVARERTRRFGLYFVLGMATSAVVVSGVAVAVWWLLSSTS